MNNGRVFWITGLSGAGKTTLAKELQRNMPGSILLDGDELREVLGVESSAFDRPGRLNLAFIYARLCKLLAAQEHNVIIATISLFREVHAWNREQLPGYMEIFLDVPEEVRSRRDSKGLYAGSQTGEVQQMAGTGVAVDFPENPDLRFDHIVPLQETVRIILNLSAK